MKTKILIALWLMMVGNIYGITVREQYIVALQVPEINEANCKMNDNYKKLWDITEDSEKPALKASQEKWVTNLSKHISVIGNKVQVTMDLLNYITSRNATIESQIANHKTTPTSVTSNNDAKIGDLGHSYIDRTESLLKDLELRPEEMQESKVGDSAMNDPEPRNISGYGNAKWGMTVEEVKAAEPKCVTFKRVIVDDPDSRQSAALCQSFFKDSYEGLLVIKNNFGYGYELYAGDMKYAYRFDIVFCFDKVTHKLVSVHVESISHGDYRRNDAMSNILTKDFNRRYGKYIHNSDPDSPATTWVLPNTVIDVIPAVQPSEFGINGDRTAQLFIIYTKNN